MLRQFHRNRRAIMSKVKTDDGTEIFFKQPAKRFELLRELLPSVSSVGILWSADSQISATEQAAGTLGIDLQTAQARSSE